MIVLIMAGIGGFLFLALMQLVAVVFVVSRVKKDPAKYGRMFMHKIMSSGGEKSRVHNSGRRAAGKGSGGGNARNTL